MTRGMASSALIFSRGPEVVLTGILCDECGKPTAGGNSEMFSKVLL